LPQARPATAGRGRALISTASTSSGVSAGWLARSYVGSPLTRCSPTSHASAPGRCWPRAMTGPSATRTRTAAGRASISSAAPRLVTEGTGCLRGRPVALRSGQASVTSAG
jgi:hypothetical protein